MATDLSLSDFRTQYPEFQNLPDSVVTPRLAMAKARCDASVWGSDRSFGIGLLTAHYCAIAPRGQDMRLQKDKGNPTTFYMLEWKNWVRAVAGGARVSSTVKELTEVERLLNR